MAAKVFVPSAISYLLTYLWMYAIRDAIVFASWIFPSYINGWAFYRVQLQGIGRGNGIQMWNGGYGIFDFHPYYGGLLRWEDWSVCGKEFKKKPAAFGRGWIYKCISRHPAQEQPPLRLYDQWNPILPHFHWELLQYLHKSQQYIAPTFPTPEELKKATAIFVLCVKLVSVEKLLEAK